MHVCLAAGDRSYQNNMVLLTEIGFLCESPPLKHQLRAKLEGAKGAGGGGAPSPCLSFTVASFVVLADITFGGLDHVTTFALSYSPKSAITLSAGAMAI